MSVIGKSLDIETKEFLICNTNRFLNGSEKILN